MVFEARGINPISGPGKPRGQYPADLSAKRRYELTNRILDNPLLGSYIMKSPVFTFGGQARNLKETIIKSLGFDHVKLNPIIDGVIERVDKMLEREILDRANAQIIDFHKEIKSSMPIPDVEGFFKLSTFGEFDPQQYLLVSTLGTSYVIMDAVAKKGVDNIPMHLINRLAERLAAGYIMLRATEIASRR